MEYKTEKYVESNVLEFCNFLLKRKDYDLDTEELPYVFTVKFDNCWEADIKVVNADPPYVDAVLFDDRGVEVMFLDPEFEQVDGHYKFECEDNIYVVDILEKE